MAMSISGALGLVLGWFLGRAATSPPPTAPDDAPAPAAAAPAGNAPANAPAIMSASDGEAFAALRDRLAALEAKIDQLPERLLVRTPIDRGAPAGVDGEMLVRAFEEANARRARQKLEGMSDAELLHEGRSLARDARDPTAARRALELLLSRNLTPETRCEALTELGIVDRNAGELAASAASLRKAVDLLGADSAGGAWAAFQLMWTVRGQNKPAEALVHAESVAAATNANESLRLHGRWHAAQLAEELGNVGRARAEYAAIARDFAGRSEYSVIVDDCKRRLGQ
jgi:hypothetical protein